MNLMDFSRQRPAKSPLVTIHWPAEAPIAVIGGQWRRLENGWIEAIYYDKEELEICIRLSQWLKEWEEEEADQNVVGVSEQPDLQTFSQPDLL